MSKVFQGESEDDISIYITENHIIFEFEKTIVVSRLIDGEYLEIDQMLSEDYETKLKVKPERL